MVKKVLKNVLQKHQTATPYLIKPGETKELVLTKSDDIHYRGLKLGHLVEVKEEPKTVSKLPKTVKKKK